MFHFDIQGALGFTIQNALCGFFVSFGGERPPAQGQDAYVKIAGNGTMFAPPFRCIDRLGRYL